MHYDDEPVSNRTKWGTDHYYWTRPAYERSGPTPPPAGTRLRESLGHTSRRTP
ncbi:hypothetical protein ACFRJ1_01160 [Streptomyces sp. NPDC056773]|uniref:hypothetical protein n=1 Tax=Streptomyces sp. NPDC056773 TaxID=3345941 RepID=UPI003690F713